MMPPHDAAAAARAAYLPALPPSLWLFPIVALGVFVLLAVIIARFRRCFQPAHGHREEFLGRPAACRRRAGVCSDEGAARGHPRPPRAAIGRRFAGSARSTLISCCATQKR